MNDILLTPKGSLALAEYISTQLKSDNPPQGDGFLYSFKYDHAYDELRNCIMREYWIMKIIEAKGKEHLYCSFETWFSSKLNLCQTRIYYSGNLTLKIGMGDGWTPNVHANVISTLKELGIEFNS